MIFSFRSCWYNLDFMVTLMMGNRPCPDAAKQDQIIILPPLCFTDAIRFLCWNVTKKFPIAFWLVHMIFIKLYTGSNVSFGEQWLSP